MKKFMNWLLNPPVDNQASIIIIRLICGAVFLSEGILKFVYPNQGVGRFTKLGFPVPDVTAHVIANLEILGGVMLLLGLYTRLIALVFVLQMIVAILTTKIGVYLGTSPLAPPPSPPQTGIWAVLHETRADYAQLLTCLFLVIEGAGRRSLDYLRQVG
ncbi:MAG: DoxX family protein [Flavipsychrobacter sp.]